MTRQLRVRGVRRKEIDEDKLAYALVLLAKELQAQGPPDPAPHSPAQAAESEDP